MKSIMVVLSTMVVAFTAHADLGMSFEKVNVILEGVYQKQIVPNDYELDTVKKISDVDDDYKLEFKNKSGECLEVIASTLMGVYQDKEGNTSTHPALAVYPPMTAKACSK